MKLKLSIIAVLIYQMALAQVPVRSNIFMAKEWSKSIALYKAKAFVLKNVLGATNDIVKFEIDPLSASNSGELTSLVYKCDTKNKEGLVLGFFGDYWNDAGVLFTGYAFKNLPAINGIRLLDNLIKIIDDNNKYLQKDLDNNNIYFQDDDMLFLIYNVFGAGNPTRIRVFWNEFDAEWDVKALSATQKKLQKKLK